MRHLLLAAFFTMATMTAVSAAGIKAPAPGEREKCPVCGMFVAKYPDWLSSITFKDATTAYFDGPKDMFRYCLSPEKYRRGLADVTAVQVKDYYSLAPIDGRQAFFVVGSDVYGPMGKELVPFASQEDARTFLRDHRGTRIVRFGEVSRELLNSLE